MVWRRTRSPEGNKISTFTDERGTVYVSRTRDGYEYGTVVGGELRPHSESAVSLQTVKNVAQRLLGKTEAERAQELFEAWRSNHITTAQYQERLSAIGYRKEVGGGAPTTAPLYEVRP